MKLWSNIIRVIGRLRFKRSNQVEGQYSIIIVPLFLNLSCTIHPSSLIFWSPHAFVFLFRFYLIEKWNNITSLKSFCATYTQSGDQEACTFPLGDFCYLLLCYTLVVVFCLILLLLTFHPIPNSISLFPIVWTNNPSSPIKQIAWKGNFRLFSFGHFGRTFLKNKF